MDTVSFRTLGGGAAHDTGLGARTPERHGHHDLAGAMALGGVIWGSAAAIAGASSTLLGAAMLLLTSLVLSRRLSISVTTNFQERVSEFLSGSVEPEDVTPIALTTELLAT